MRALLLHRVGAHRTALVAVATSVLTSMLVVATLQLLSVGISDAAVRAELDVPARERGAVLTALLRPGELADADRRVREAVDDGGSATLTRTATATTRGLRGGAENDRVLLAEVDRIGERARLVSGAWPAAPAAGTRPGGQPVEAVLPERAAAALGVSAGDRLALTDLIDRDTAPLEVAVVGVFVPTGVEEGRWADEPLGLRGVTRTDFTTYGPVVLAEGAFDTALVGASSVTWRWTPDLDGMTGARLPGLRERVDAVIDRLERVSGAGTVAPEGEQRPLRDGRLTSSLPAVLDRAEVSGTRVRSALLAPTVLLVVLGASSLVVAAALLAALRDPETRLLRTRGASTGRLAALSAADAVAVVAVGAVGSLLGAPLLARAVARGAGLPPDRLGATGGTAGLPWLSVALMAVLAGTVVVSTTLRVGRARGGARGGAGGAARVLRALGSSGLDVALVGLSVLGVVQLRRYDGSAGAAADPLTVAAPALVVAGSAVLCLRLLPVLSRQVARVTSTRPGLDVAWGGWQLSRRLAAQSGTVLLVLLAVSMGSLALAHSATAERAVEDQSAFETGAPARVVTGAVGGARLAEVAGRLGAAAGGAERVTPVLRESVALGPVTDVTVLALDAAVAGRVVDPRPDTLDGQSWSSLTERLTAGRASLDAPTLPDDATSLTLTMRLDARAGAGARAEATANAVLRDGTGLLTTLRLGTVRAAPADLTVDLPAPRGGPWQLVGVTGTVSSGIVLGGGSLPPVVTPTDPGTAAYGLVIDEALTTGPASAAAGTPVQGLERIAERPSPGGLSSAVLAPAIDAVPALMTRAAASATETSVGGRLEVQVAGRAVPVEVVAIVEAVPTAAQPDRAVVVDLPTLLLTPEPPVADRRLSPRVVEPGEWWLDPHGTVDADDLRADLPAGSTVALRSEVVDDRLANPVNAGMRAGMTLVTAAALVLAAVGFAATTAALGRERRRENAVLLALGMPPGRIRRTLEAERVAVVALTVVVGLVLGVLSSLAVVPVLVGGDGHRQVPGVLVSLPWLPLVLFAALVAAVLAAVGVLVLRRVGSDVAAELRRGGS
ncbi:FtsX-like permease family protein [Oryzobacter sp. R7]|uniref:FtsX-like permease family protein n=1 Tax=Oryzobacter faecalis TaxID=3388656 RepID=UPI00398D54D7